MKNSISIILIAILIAISSLSKAQTRDYIPMLNQGAVWFETYTDYNLPPSPYGYNHAAKLYLDGDTSINGLNYVKLYKAFVDLQCQEMMEEPFYYSALREDTEGQKVWIVDYDQSEEVLFFDFSLNEGDSIPESCYFSRNFYPLTIANIDTVTTYDGLERRKWQFNLEGWFFGGSEVIEGIGSINGLMAGFIFPELPYWDQLYCFSINNLHVYPNPNPSYCILPSDTCLTVGIEPEVKRPHGFMVYPNPVKSNTNLLYIQAPNHAVNINVIEIINSNGAPISRTNYNDQCIQLDVTDLTSGFYILRIIATKQVFYQKIKIQ